MPHHLDFLSVLKFNHKKMFLGLLIIMINQMTNPISRIFGFFNGFFVVHDVNSTLEFKLMICHFSISCQCQYLQ